MDTNSIIHAALLINKKHEDTLLLENAFRTSCPGTRLVRADDAEEGIGTMMREKIDAVFIDSSLTTRTYDFFRELRKRNIGAPVVVIVEEGEAINAAEAMKAGAYDYIIKRDDCSAALECVIERIRGATMPEKELGLGCGQHLVLFEQIYRSQKWWQNIIDSITDYLFVIDGNYKILRTNKAFAGLFGKEPADIIMKPYYELFGMNEPHEWCVIPEKDSRQAPRSLEREIDRTEYLISCFPIYHDEHNAAVYIMKDITETRRLKDQIYHLDKLSSLGTLTSGVAHEINNPLTGIIGYTEMLLMQEPEGNTGKYLRKVYDSAIRCKGIVENMLTFSRQSNAQKSPEDINRIIERTIALHEYQLKSTNIEIVKDYGKLPHIEADPQQMQQVFLNLLINAEHAVSESGKKGRIEFSTTHNKAENSITVTVSDNGNGIPKDFLPRIFDPFFTTKPVNKGTGLGLSITHGIIAEQGGDIEVKSAIGKGTSFIIKLPLN